MLYCSWGALSSLSALLLSWGPLYAPLEDSWPISTADAVTEASVLCSAHASSRLWVSQGCSLLLCCAMTHQSLQMLLAVCATFWLAQGMLLLIFPPFLLAYLHGPVALHMIQTVNAETLNKKTNFVWIQIQLGLNMFVWNEANRERR